tara:strand:+ start:990 stop:1187 length:198 start_codon:yes stop_codon:yes gene_type:complete
VTNNLKYKVEDITMELLAERYIGICEENGMFFNNYKNACKEEALKEIIKGDKKNVIKNRKNKSNR